MNSCSHQLRSPRGFTMLELLVVIVLMGILAALAVPSITAASETRGIGATRELERRLVHARSRALSTGEPTGIAFASNGTLTMMRIATIGALPTVAPGPTGAAGASWSLPIAYSGVAISGMVGGDGSGTLAQTIWFGFDGTPEIRTGSGFKTGSFTQDATVTLTGPGAGAVKILKGSGVVER